VSPFAANPSKPRNASNSLCISLRRERINAALCRWITQLQPRQGIRGNLNLPIAALLRLRCGKNDSRLRIKPTDLAPIHLRNLTSAEATEEADNERGK